ncbi:MAG: oligopeptide/dipeptide ABC transporter ATP-binding protein, partial [Nocardioidaceae bacterium]
SMLDMSVRAKILDLMIELKERMGLTYVYVTHDLATAKFFCDRVAIMYLGRIVEIGPTEEIFADPKHPYTRALLRAIPEPDPARQVPRDLPRGEIPDAASPPLGCAFHPRCPKAVGECGWESRDLRALFEERWTHLEPSVYEQERATLGALDVLDAPATRVTVGLAGGAEATHGLLDRVRAEAPDEPFWSGIEALNDTPSGVEVVFRSGVDPQLRSVGDVRVACVLYPEDPDNPDKPVATGHTAAG